MASEERQDVPANPDVPLRADDARRTLLHAIDWCAKDACMGAMDEAGMDHLASAALKFSQAYLLIDPLVDAQGIPVAGQAMAGAAADIVKQAAAPPPAPADGQAHGTVKRRPGGPPKVSPGAAAEVMDKMHERAQGVLSEDRGSRPLPRPRAGA